MRGNPGSRTRLGVRALLWLAVALAGGGCGGRTLGPTVDAGRDGAARDSVIAAGDSAAADRAAPVDTGCELYPITFTCTSAGGATCPAGQPCPTVPWGSGGCDDLPGVFGPPIPVDAGRPRGCEVGLPYGDPDYGCTQEQCTCGKFPSPTDAGASPQWVCPM